MCNAIRNKSKGLTIWQNVRIVLKQITAYQIIREWNALQDPLISSAEGAEDGVAKFTSLVRAGDISMVRVLVNDCHSDVTPLNNSESFRFRRVRILSLNY